jgi:hypothetical protein
VVNALGIAGLHKFLKYSTWFRTGLAPLVRERLAAASTEANGIFNAAFISQVAEQHISGRRNFLAEINAILTLEAVERLFFQPTNDHLISQPNHAQTL